MAIASDAWLATVARRLEALASSVVFVGGATISLLIDDPASVPVRPTDDLDAIIEISSRERYYALEAKLRSLGFRPDNSEGAPLCRWKIDGVVVDVMPTSAEILGFGNRWYPAAITHAVERELEPGLAIRIATAPYFIAMKLEAFSGRGQGDYVASHDLEDIVAIVDGRERVVTEIEATDDDLRHYLAQRFRALLATSAFVDAIPGHLAGDAASQARLPLVMDRLRRIAGAS